jgi:hypothetical protein
MNFTPGYLDFPGVDPGEKRPQGNRWICDFPWGTLGYWQICSKLKKCATPGKLAKIPGGTPGYMALKSTKTTSSEPLIQPLLWQPL